MHHSTTKAHTQIEVSIFPRTLTLLFRPKNSKKLYKGPHLRIKNKGKHQADGSLVDDDRQKINRLDNTFGKKRLEITVAKKNAMGITPRTLTSIMMMTFFREVRAIISVKNL